MKGSSFMPVKRLPSNLKLDYLKYQARDLLKEYVARLPRHRSED